MGDKPQRHKGNKDQIKNLCVFVVLLSPSLTSLEVENETAKFDLRFIMREVGQELLGAFEYNKDLFDASTIERMVLHYQTLLEAIVTNPE